MGIFNTVPVRVAAPLVPDVVSVMAEQGEATVQTGDPCTLRGASIANEVDVWLKCEVFAPTLTLVDTRPIAVLNVVAFPDPSPRNVVMPEELNLFPKLDETPSLPFI